MDDNSTATRLRSVLEDTEKVVKIAFFISGVGSNMLHIDDRCRSGELKANISLVIADRVCPGTIEALKRGIPVVVLPVSGDITSFIRQEWTDILLQVLVYYQIDLVCLGGFMKILGKRLTDCYRRRVINIHPGLLPQLTGKDPQIKALALGLKFTGNTVHMVTDKVDDSSIILASDTVPILYGDTEFILSNRLKLAGYNTYLTAIQNWIKLFYKEK